MERTREEYRAKMEGRLEEWGRWIEDLGKKLEKAGAAAKKDLAADLSELKDLERSTLAHLVAFETAAATTWADARGELTDAWNKVSGTTDAIWSRVRAEAKTANAAGETACCSARGAATENKTDESAAVVRLDAQVVALLKNWMPTARGPFVVNCHRRPRNA